MEFFFYDEEKQVLYLTNNDIPVKSTELTAPTLVPAIGYNFNLQTNCIYLQKLILMLRLRAKKYTHQF